MGHPVLTQAPCHQYNAIWSNDHARPEPSPFTEATEPTVHSAISALLSFSISLPIYSVTNNASFYRSTTSLDRTLPTYCLAEWRPRPPSMELCVVSMELWARHMGRHCVVDKIVTFWGREFPFFSGFTQKIIFQQGLSISAYRSSTDLDMDQGRNWKTLQQKLQVLCFLSAVFHWAVQQIWGGILIRKLLMRPLSITRHSCSLISGKPEERIQFIFYLCSKGN